MLWFTVWTLVKYVGSLQRELKLFPAIHRSMTDKRMIGRVQVTSAVTEALEWMDENQDAEEDDYKEKLKEVQDVCQPIVAAAYQAAGGAGGEEDDSDMGDHDEL